MNICFRCLTRRPHAFHDDGTIADESIAWSGPKHLSEQAECVSCHAVTTDWRIVPDAPDGDVEEVCGDCYRLLENPGLTD